MKKNIRHIACVALVLSALSACTMVDADRARLCRIALPALEPAGTRIAVIRTRPIENGVRIDYRATLGAAASSHAHAAATNGADGFLSATDKTKLDGIAADLPRYRTTIVARIDQCRPCTSPSLR